MPVFLLHFQDAKVTKFVIIEGLGNANPILKLILMRATFGKILRTKESILKFIVI